MFEKQLCQALSLGNNAFFKISFSIQIDLGLFFIWLIFFFLFLTLQVISQEVELKAEPPGFEVVAKKSFNTDQKRRLQL